MSRYVQCPKDGQREYFSNPAKDFMASGLTPIAFCGFCGQRLAITPETIMEDD